MPCLDRSVNKVRLDFYGFWYLWMGIISGQKLIENVVG